jgi:hypothetical protein
VESTRDGYEIRRYAPQIVAEVQVQGEYDSAMNRGFRLLADYIFGNNTVGGGSASGAEEASGEIAMTAPVLEQQVVEPEVTSQKIAMTAPVLEQEPASETHVVTFVMPAEYTMESLPAPRNEEVRLVEVPERRYAALQFSGRVSGERALEMKQKLRERLAQDGLATVGAPMLAQYNPPWTPPPMRKNEVLIRLE